MTDIKLTLEEEVLTEAGLLDYEGDDGTELPPAERSSALTVAREELQELVGHVTKIDFQGHQVWNVSEDLPINKNVKIRYMFASRRDDLAVDYSPGDVRVYVEPKQSLPGDSFGRITINRVSPAVLHEALTRDAFVDQVSGEVKSLMDLEEQFEECSACGEPVPEENDFCGSCGVKMPVEETPPAAVTAPS